jgi:nucleotide-binding universal stress UspA family protein
VGERGRRTRRAGPLRAFRRWIRAAGMEPSPVPLPTATLSSGAIVQVAIATTHQDEAQFEALRAAVKRLLETEPNTRLACVTVVKGAPELGGDSEEETATSQHIKHLVRLRHWAEPLQLPASRLSFHVLESGDPAEALLEYARLNQVDHVVIGAPPPDVPLKGLLGTVATKVAIEAPCTVTVVRARA